VANVVNKKHENETAPEKKIVVCISGMAGTGKSTLAKKIAKKYRLKYYSGGDALKALAVEQGYDSKSIGWWESPEGLGFLAKREQNLKFDKLVDNKLLEFAQKGNVLLDSWTMPWLIDHGFKIWLAASIDKRAERISKRDKMDKSKALKVLRKKEAGTKKIYNKLYGFKLGEDFKPFDFILDTEKLDAKEVFNVLCMVIESIILTKKD
jgi:cytidylate kinase